MAVRSQGSCGSLILIMYMYIRYEALHGVHMSQIRVSAMLCFLFQALSDVINTTENEKDLIIQLQTNAKRDTEKIQEFSKARYVKL